MLFRNLLSMSVEESIRANPIDGVVLLGGCDKTTPGQVMGACSVNLPTIVVSSGPMLNVIPRTRHRFRYRRGNFSEAVRSGKMSMTNFLQAESGMSRLAGTV